tara:strand:- start:1597 stop:1806 length:210 start_codon:yes stop_codon:yes gene_type:complete
MGLNKGDLVRTLPKVEKIKAVAGKLHSDMIGVIVETNPKFNNTQVYGVLLDGEVYFLFEDEIEKVEGEC